MEVLLVPGIDKNRVDTCTHTHTNTTCIHTQTETLPKEGFEKLTMRRKGLGGFAVSLTNPRRPDSGTHRTWPRPYHPIDKARR